MEVEILNAYETTVKKVWRFPGRLRILSISRFAEYVTQWPIAPGLRKNLMDSEGSISKWKRMIGYRDSEDSGMTKRIVFMKSLVVHRRDHTVLKELHFVHLRSNIRRQLQLLSNNRAAKIGLYTAPALK